MRIYKKQDGMDEELFKNEVKKICDRQIRVPGSEALWCVEGAELDGMPVESIPNYKISQFYFSKIQSSLNPFLTIGLTILTAKILIKKFKEEIRVVIYDDFEFPITKEIESYSWFKVFLWLFIPFILTPLWLIFYFSVKVFK